MKKILSAILLVVTLLTISATVCLAKTEESHPLRYGFENPEGLDISAASAILIEAKTGAVLYHKNQENRQSPASVTKIMTLLLVCEAISDGKISLTDSVAISSYAASMGGSQVFLEEGETLTVEELLKCTVIASANDAAVALAELVSGTEGNFVAEMNKRAAELGMKNTKFENVTGLDDTTKEHLTSAEDIAIMSMELIKYEIITKYSSLWQDSIRDGEFTLTNTNRLVRFYEGCNGLKTGSTDKAGFCVSASAKRGNMQLIAVIMGAPTRDERNADARALLDYGFSTYALFEHTEQDLEAVRVKKGSQDTATAYSKEFCAVVPRADVKKVEAKYDIPEAVSAPLKSGDKIGAIAFSVGDKSIGITNVCVREDVSAITFWGIFIRMIRNTLK